LGSVQKHARLNRNKMRGFPTISRIVAWSVFVLVTAMIVHVYFSYADSAPKLSYDDTLANIATALADHNRFGFLISPLQGYTQHIRSENFYNVGYPYFFAGAALTWFFGSSVEIVRLIHPLVLIFICLFAFAAFRRASFAAPALFSVVVFILFYKAHWPSARADIMVSLFAFAALLAWIRVHDTGGRRQLFWIAFTGFLVSNAFITHPISWGVAGAMVPAWLVWLWRKGDILDWRKRLPLLKESVLAAVAGIGVALFLWGISIDFAFIDLLSEWKSYATGSGEINPLGVTEILQRHWELGWGEFIGHTWFRYLLFLGGLSVAASILTIAFAPRTIADAFAKYVLPPALAWIGYQISLSLYPNFHSGYNILHPLLFSWACIAIIPAAAEILKTYRPRLHRAVDALGAAATLVLALTVFTHTSTTENHWQRHAAQSTAMSSLLSEVVEIMPQHARVWGDAIFGLGTGSRLDLIQLREALTLVEGNPEAVRPALAPDYLIIGASSQQSMVFQTSSICGSPERSRTVPANSIWRLRDLFPNVHFNAVKVVRATPYNSTAIYRRGADASPPLVAWNNGENTQWTYRSRPVDAGGVNDVGPASFRLQFNSGNPEFVADRTKSLDLATGTYAITIKLQRDDSAGGILLASSTTSVAKTAVDGGFDFGVSPYFSGQDTVTMLVGHIGGPLYISQCDFERSTDFSVMNVAKLVPLASRPDDVTKPQEVPLPPLSAWRVMTENGVKIQKQTDGEIEVTTGTGHLGKSRCMSISWRAAMSDSEPATHPTASRIIRRNNY
jgi:hypothetical protein